MTPAARIAAAIDCLDPILEGAPAERVLTTWARRNRYAGSGDRAAIRDLVFDALRQRRSFGWLGGGDNGRALMIGSLVAEGADLDAVFSGERFAPSALASGEGGARSLEGAPDPVRLDCPDWLWPLALESLGSDAETVFALLKTRAPVCLRVNLARGSVAEALSALGEDKIAARAMDLSPSALEVTENPRRVQQSRAYREGLVELQDVASQAVVDRLFPWVLGKSVLDYCAGGGGKALALAASGAGKITAHDATARRMQDIPARAARAGARIVLAEDPQGTFDLVLCDAPCSGSGAWRRQPDAKWRLTPQRLAELTGIQDDILSRAALLVAPGGRLAYATCSLLATENEARAAAFLGDHPGWSLVEQHRLSSLQGGDGFFLAIFARS